MKTKRFTPILILSLLLASCTSLGNYFKAVPAYDQKSYESFTYLKADVLMFYDAFTTGISGDTYTEFIIRFNRIGEYESGKSGNDEVVQQLAIVRDMFSRHCNEVRVKPYSETMLANKKELISMAFDVIIKTEYSKKK